LLAVRLARAEERESLEALQWRASLANERDRQNLEANPDAIHLPPKQIERGQVFVAELDGHVAGFSVILQEDGHLELDGLFVEPDIWRRGVGAALIDAAAHEARKRGLALMVVANPHALGFYRRCGFSGEGSVETRFGSGVRMSR
jgi:GNAT superfamily N-acetyltransferase